MTNEDNSNHAPHSRQKRTGLSHELFHGLTPEEFDTEAQAVAATKAMTPQVRARLKAQLVERLRTPVDAPSWGPDWVRQGERHAPRHNQQHNRKVGLAALMPSAKNRDAQNETPDPLNQAERSDAQAIARNLEKSRQVAHYRPLYLLGALLAVAIALLAMFVDYQIIHGDVWTRALSNEFMVVPDSLQSSVVFKSMQVIFAVLIVHFMLKITGAYGRNTMITVAFVMALVMVGSLGYLVAYNNMSGATSATYENAQNATTLPDSSNAIDQLFASVGTRQAAAQSGTSASAMPAVEMREASLPLPKISKSSLADADSFLWLVFASVIFFIVTVVAALYLQTVENNIRNFLIARDYKHRQRQFAQLQMLELGEQRT